MPCHPLKCQCGKLYLPQRYMMVVLVGLALIIVFVQTLSFTMIASYLGAPNNLTVSPCGEAKDSKAESVNEWDRFAQALLFGSFFIGYILMLLPGGYMADKLGGRFVCIVSVFASSVLTLFFPIMVNYTYFWLVCTGRAFIGGSNACIMTSAASLISRWIPRTEWSTVGGAVFASGTLGIIFSNILGSLAQDCIGWQALFYIWGGVGMIWCICALIWLYSDPYVHPTITAREKAYLEEEAKKRNPRLPLDWVAILLDPAVWGIAAAQVGHSYLAFALATNMSNYYINVLNLDMWDNVIYIILPYILLWVMAILSGMLADYFIHNKGWRPTIIRKVYYTIATIIPAILVVIIPAMECGRTVVLLLAAFGLVMTGPFSSSARVNVLDITYNYSGFVTGAVCICGAVVGAIEPYIVEQIARDNTFSQWRLIAYIIFVNAVLNNILYFILGSSKRRLWDMTPEERQYYRDLKQKEDEAKRAREGAAAAPKTPAV